MFSYIISTRGAARPKGAAIAFVLAAIVSVPAAAQTPQPAPLPGPVPSTIEIGPGGIVDPNFKSGEYNGLNKEGAFAIANVDLRDRAAYDSVSAARWSIKGRDLGLDTRTILADFGVQGRVRARLGFDQIERNRSDTFQTILDGSGTTNLRLPSNWLLPVIASPAGTTTSARGLIPSIGTAPYLSTAAANQGALITPTASQMSTVTLGALSDVPTFRNVDLSTTRKRYLAGVSYNFNERWAADATIVPEHKDGLKPMGTVSRNTGADISTIIPDRIDNNHNQFDTNLHFTGKKSSLQVGYYGSFFTNNVSSMSWQNWATATKTVNTMSSAPSNTFNQVNASGMVKLGATTKLVANGSYGRASQNDAFMTDSTTPVVPVTSLNGLIVNTLFNTRLTSRPTKRLNVSASYKYNDRDNRTPINIYQYADTGEAPTVSALFPAGPNNPLGALVAQNANANRPYSRTQNLLVLEADYALGGGQWIKGGYDFERLDRACNGTWISCSDAARTNENTARVDWRRNVGSELTARVGYARSMRRAPLYNENAFLALVPYANVSPTTATGGATAYSFMTANGFSPWGPALGYSATTGNMNVFFPSNNALANGAYGNGNRISEIAGFRRYWVADRDRDKLRSALSWQPNDVFGFQGGFDLNNDNYPNSPYGLQSGKGWSANADFNYVPTDNFSADVYYTYENLKSLSRGNSYTANSNTATVANQRPGAVFLSGNTCNTYTTLQQRNNNNKLDPCLNWASNTLDDAHTVGFLVRRKIAKTDWTADLFYTRVRSDNTVDGGNYANNPVNGLGGPPTTIAAYFIAATPLPTVKEDNVQLRVNAIFPVMRNQSLHASYVYSRLTSADWMYEGTQIGVGTIAGVLPVGELPFNYNTNAFGISYIFHF